MHNAGVLEYHYVRDAVGKDTDKTEHTTSAEVSADMDGAQYKAVVGSMLQGLDGWGNAMARGSSAPAFNPDNIEGQTPAAKVKKSKAQKAAEAEQAAKASQDKWEA